ncbi:MAG: hypothetical protein J2P37_35800, partial [Ktedonobacteraceae bacterium]|nr:hypothetical protein [Ktedonobacteraceae bacterium]
MSDPTLSPQTDSPWFPTLSPLEHGFPDPLALSLQSGIMVCSAIATVVELGLADVFEEGPASVQTLARQTQTHEPTLYLLLRALASIGIFKEIEDHLFEHTHRSRLLRAEAMAPLVAL